MCEVGHLFADGFVCEGLHCDPILCACWHDGSELLSRQHSRALLFPRRHGQSVSIHSCFSTRFCVGFRTTDEDNQEIDFFVASFKFVAVPCSMGYSNFDTPRCPSGPHPPWCLPSCACCRSMLCDDSSTCSTILLACVWLIGLWNAVPSNIVDGFQTHLVSLSTNAHSVGSLITLQHHRENRHLADYLLSLCALSRA